MTVERPLDAGQIRAALQPPGGRWRDVEVVASCASTNADLAGRARAGAEPDVLLIAAEQTAGRGRFTREWSSPVGTSLSVSALVRPHVEPSQWSLLPLVAGVAVSRGVASLGAGAALKWPNDVLIDGLKVCGILAELVAAPAGPLIVLGIGLNVAQTTDQLPVPTATSLRIAGLTVTREQAAIEVLGALGAVLAQWDAEGWGNASQPGTLADEYTARCSTLGRDVRVLTAPGSHVDGTAVGISTEGQLLVRVAGEVRAFSAGDVHHLR